MDAIRQQIKNHKTLNILYLIVDNTITKNEVINRIGQARYEYYYPLYLITKNRSLRELIRSYIMRIRIKNNIE